MKPVFFAATAVTVLLLGCQSSAPTFTDAERASVAAEIEAARDAYFEAATDLDADAMTAFWDRDFIHVSNASIAPLTCEALKEAWKPLSRIEMNVTSDRVFALTRNSGYTMSTASYVVYDASGAAVHESDWAGTHIWIRTADGWKVHAVHEGRPVRE
jgi:hypothetical protein